MSDVREPLWVARVKAVAKFHQDQLKEDPHWTLEKTSGELHRSIGRISEDLMLVNYMRTHPRVETFKSVQQAVDYCRKIKRQQKMGV